MAYQHRFVDNSLFSAEVQALPVGKLVCVGRNYADHAAEMGSEIPEEPILFLKPASSLVALEEPLTVPTQWGSCHFETELAVLVGKRLCRANEAQAAAAIAAVGVGLDLTLRDLQRELKQKQLPWDKAKGFDGSAAVSRFIPPPAELQDIGIRLSCNGALRQQGSSAQMITPVVELLRYASSFFTLEAGDILLTGTPAGVGPLQAGDQLCAELVGLLKVETQCR